MRKLMSATCIGLCTVGMALGWNFLTPDTVALGRFLAYERFICPAGVTRINPVGHSEA